MRIVEFPRLGAFARSLDFNEADQRVADGDSKIRTCFEIGKRGLADEMDRLGRQAGDLGQVLDQALERSAELIFRGTFNSDARQLWLGTGAEIRDDGCDRFARQ
jgi:hypothetical protein